MSTPRFGFYIWRYGFWLRAFGCFLRVINRRHQPPTYSTRKEGEWKLGTWGIKLGLNNSKPSSKGGAMISYGIPIAFGICDPKPITNLPPGAKVRIRMRKTGCVQIFVWTNEDVRQYRAKRVGETWELWPAQGIGANVRRYNAVVGINGANERKDAS